MKREIKGGKNGGKRGISGGRSWRIVLKLGMHKLGPDAPTISKNQVIWMKTQKMAAYLASPPLKVRLPLYFW